MKTAEILLLCTVVICGASDFVSVPHVTKYDPGDTAVLEWTLAEDFDISSRGSEMTIYRGTVLEGTFFVKYSRDTRICDNQLDPRRSCIIPESVGKTVGFKITNITTADGEDYSCQVFYSSLEPFVTNKNATLYVFGTPSVTIEGSTSEPEGTSVTLTCSATSNSIPPGVVTAEFVYNWIISNPASNHYILGDNVVNIDSAVSANNGATFKCSVGEAGSSLTNETTAYLTITASTAVEPSTITTAGPSTGKPTTTAAVTTEGPSTASPTTAEHSTATTAGPSTAEPSTATKAGPSTAEPSTVTKAGPSTAEPSTVTTAGPSTAEPSTVTTAGPSISEPSTVTTAGPSTARLSTADPSTAKLTTADTIEQPTSVPKGEDTTLAMIIGASVGGGPALIVFIVGIVMCCQRAANRIVWERNFKKATF